MELGPPGAGLTLALPWLLQLPAVFLDRDGVLVRDTEPLIAPEQIEILPGVPEALARLRGAGYRLVVVTNQAVVARGVLSETALLNLQMELNDRLVAAGGPSLDAFYFCPHHPNANLAAYRLDCDCRKPRPGLLRRAAVEHGLDLGASFMVGDRMTDIEAGHRAGCRTIWVQTGGHLKSRIVTTDPPMPSLEPTHVCADLREAVGYILAHR